MHHKLKPYGVVDPILSILKSSLQEGSLKIVLDGQSSPFCITNAGVPQGSVLGPTFFLVSLVRDDVLSRIGLYALSIPVLVNLFFRKVLSGGELELDLCSIAEWGDRWLLTFNATKTLTAFFQSP